MKKLGFELVFIEKMSYYKQVELMQRLAKVVGSNRTAITNVLFCQPETHVVEIADLSIPNPNFYARYSAMGHHYWILDEEGVGEGHPLKKD